MSEMGEAGAAAEPVANEIPANDGGDSAGDRIPGESGSAETPDGVEGLKAPAEGDEGGTEGADKTDKTPDAATEGKHTVKVDGREMEVDLDELKRGYSRGKTFTQRMQAAKTHRAETEAMIDRAEAQLYDSPGKLLAKLGPEAVERAVLQLVESNDPTVQAAIDRAVKVASGPVEERARREVAERERRIEEREQALEEQRQAERLDADTAQAQNQMLEGFTKALEGTGLNVQGGRIPRMATLYKQLHTPGAPLDPTLMAEAASIVREEYDADVADYRAREADKQKAEEAKRLEEAKKKASEAPSGTRQAPARRRREPPPSLEAVRDAIEAKREEQRMKDLG